MISRATRSCATASGRPETSAATGSQVPVSVSASAQRMAESLIAVGAGGVMIFSRHKCSRLTAEAGTYQYEFCPRPLRRHCRAVAAAGGDCLPHQGVGTGACLHVVHVDVQ